MISRKDASAIPVAVRDLFEAHPSPVHFFRDDNSNIWVNRAMNDLLGYEDGELAALDTTDIYFEYDKANHSRLVQDFVELGYAKGIIEVRRKDGRALEIAFLSAANVLPAVHLTIWDPPLTPILRHDHFDWPAVAIDWNDRLTVRESQVISLLADGAGNDQIAAALGIVPATVQQHVDSCRAKLGASNRAELVSRAIARRDIEPKQPGQALLVLADRIEGGDSSQDGVRWSTITYVSPAARIARPSISRLIGTSIGTSIEVRDSGKETPAVPDPGGDLPSSTLTFDGDGPAHLSGMLFDVFGSESVAAQTGSVRERSFLTVQMK